jgi:hypothetical protein
MHAMRHSIVSIGRGRILPSPLALGVFFEAPLIFVAFTVWFVIVRHDGAMQDFLAVLSGAHAVLHGASPYPPPDAAVLLQAKSLVYPPLIAYMFVPLAVLPHLLAATLYVLASLSAVPVALWLLGVRDWRCFGIVFLWDPFLAAVRVGAIGPMLVLLCAIAWRFRGRLWIVAPAVAMAVVLKLFLWPLAIWLLATRRWRAFVATCGLTVCAFLIPFLPLGYGVLRTYPSVLRTLNETFGPHSFSTPALFEAFGVSSTAATGCVALLAVILVAVIARLGVTRGGDRRAFAGAVLSSLLLSPIVWTHYYVLLAVPIALTMRRLTPLWLLPLLFWTTPALEAAGNLRLLLTALTVTLVVAARTIAGERPVVPVPAKPEPGPGRRSTAECVATGGAVRGS